MGWNARGSKSNFFLDTDLMYRGSRRRQIMLAISTYRYCVYTDGNICKYSYMISGAFCLPGTIGPCRAVCYAEAKVPFLRWTMCAWPSSLANSPWRTAGSRRCNQKSRPLLIMLHVAQTRIITPGRRFRFGHSRTWRHGAQHVAKKSSFYIVIVADTSYTRGLSNIFVPRLACSPQSSCLAP